MLSETQQQKCVGNGVRARFAEAYPMAGRPNLCRVPGRINLIGEHVDYNGLPVLPMAIDRDTVIAYAPRADGQIHLHNAGPDFGPDWFTNGPHICPSPAGAWTNYVKAAIVGLNEAYAPAAYPGMDLYVSGEVPVAAGLSSSTSLVVASALAYLDVLGLRLDVDVDRIELATLLAEAEHYVGTRGGGMDHAILLLGKRGHACKIDFIPMRVEETPLFDDYVVVACHTMVRAHKTGESMHRYNEGPVTCRLLCALVEAEAREAYGDEVELSVLGDLWYGPLCLTDAEARTLIDRAAPEPHTTLDAASRRLGISVEQIRRRWLGDLPEPPEGFALQARARHQLTEYERVERARDLLLAGDVAGFGELMYASHASCAGDYRVSCPELDALVDIARDAGAVGARMTGAGFGGCTVNLVHAAEVEAFRAAVHAGYYAPRGVAMDELETVVLTARPADGAGYASD